MANRKSVLVLGTGLEVEHALRLSSAYNVYYWTHFMTAFPEFNDFSYGLGFEGIKKIMFPFYRINDVDLIATFDIGYGDIIDYFRKQGKICFGAGRGEKLELDRWYLKNLLKHAGLPVMKTWRVKGIDRLRDILKNNNNVIVKISVFRGDCETFYSPSYDEVEPLLDILQVKWGKFAEGYEFIVEQEIKDAVEAGIDGIFSPANGFCFPLMWGIENHSAYIGVWGYRIPEWFVRTEPHLKNILTTMDYRGFISTEQRIVNKNKDYLIDITARIPHPLGHIFTTAIRNYPEVIFRIANNQKVTLDVKEKFWGCLPVRSDELNNVSLEVRFPDKYRPYIKFSTAYKKDGKYYASKGGTIVCSIVYGADTIDKVIEGIKKIGDEIKVVRAKKEYHLLDEIKEEIDKLKSMGIEFI